MLKQKRLVKVFRTGASNDRNFTLIELLVVIAIIAILLRSKWLFFLLFSAIFAFSCFDGKTLNTQIPNITFSMIT